MQPEVARRTRSLARRRLDQRLGGLDLRVGPRPAHGWIRAIREALGMSSSDLAQRVGVTPSRVRQLERTEAEGAILLSSLERCARALDCHVCYALVPRQPLEQMVWRQAFDKAARLVHASVARTSPGNEAVCEEEDEVISEQIEDLAHQLVDGRGLWWPTTRSSGKVRPPDSDD